MPAAETLGSRTEVSSNLSSCMPNMLTWARQQQLDHALLFTSAFYLRAEVPAQRGPFGGDPALRLNPTMSSAVAAKMKMWEAQAMKTLLDKVKSVGASHSELCDASGAHDHASSILSTVHCVNSIHRCQSTC